MKRTLLVLSPFTLLFSGAIFSQTPNNWKPGGNLPFGPDVVNATNNSIGPLGAFNLNFRAGTIRMQLTTTDQLNLLNAGSAYQIGGNNVLWHKGNTSNIFVGVNSGTANVTGIRTPL